MAQGDRASALYSLTPRFGAGRPGAADRIRESVAEALAEVQVHSDVQCTERRRRARVIFKASAEAGGDRASGDRSNQCLSRR